MKVTLRHTRTEQGHSLLLYCPFDRKMTRHARRDGDGSIACVECGRRLDFTDRSRAGQGPTTAPGAPISILDRATVTHRTARVRTGASPSAMAWIATLLVGAITLLALVNVTGNLLRPSSPPIPAAGRLSDAVPLAGGTALLVANTDGIGAYIRHTPNLEDHLRAWPEGTILRSIGEDLTVGGVEWRRVRDPAGNEGWIPVQYTVPLEPD